MGRIERVNQQVRREVSRIIQQEMGDPRLEFVTITGVSVTPDLRNAKVYFSVLGDTRKRDNAQKCLNGARGMIRKFIGQRIKIRYIPEFVFVYDDSIEVSARIERTLQEIHDESKQGYSNDQEQ